MEDEQVVPLSWTAEQIRAANKDIDDRMDAVAGSHYGRCRVNDNGTISHGGAHGDHECPAIAITARTIDRLTSTVVTGANKRVAMIQGLVRSAEALEQDPNRAPSGKIWDDSCRVALEIARDYGWGKGQVGSLPMQPPPDFQKELCALINVYSQENASHTPDFILASYLQACLDTWNLHTRERDRWFGNRSLRGPGVDDSAFPPVPASEKSLLP